MTIRCYHSDMSLQFQIFLSLTFCLMPSACHFVGHCFLSCTHEPFPQSRRVPPLYTYHIIFFIFSMHSQHACSVTPINVTCSHMCPPELCFLCKCNVFCANDCEWRGCISSRTVDPAVDHSGWWGCVSAAPGERKKHSSNEEEASDWRRWMKLRSEGLTTVKSFVYSWLPVSVPPQCMLPCNTQTYVLPTIPSSLGLAKGCR